MSFAKFAAVTSYTSAGDDLLLLLITLQVAENEWSNICNFHTGHFLSGPL